MEITVYKCSNTVYPETKMNNEKNIAELVPKRSLHFENIFALNPFSYGVL